MADGHGGKRKGAGRPRGSKSRRTLDVESQLHQLGMNPLEAMVEIYENAKEAGDLRLAGQMARELAQYVAPKRRAIDLTAETKASSEELVKAILKGRERARML